MLSSFGVTVQMVCVCVCVHVKHEEFDALIQPWMIQLTVCNLLQLLQFFCLQFRVFLSHNSTAKKVGGARTISVYVQLLYTSPYTQPFAFALVYSSPGAASVHAQL